VRQIQLLQAQTVEFREHAQGFVGYRGATEIERGNTPASSLEEPLDVDEGEYGRVCSVLARLIAYGTVVDCRNKDYLIPRKTQSLYIFKHGHDTIKRLIG